MLMMPVNIVIVGTTPTSTAQLSLLIRGNARAILIWLERLEVEDEEGKGMLCRYSRA